MSSMRERVVFTVGADVYRWDDVFRDARRRDEWARLELEVREGAACLDAGRAPPAQEVRSAATAFRYERGLLAAEDLEEWLAERGLTLAGWLDHVRRTVARERHAGELEELVRAHPGGVSEERLLTTGVCTGTFAAFARSLAAHAAVRRDGEELDAALDRFRHEVLAGDDAIQKELELHRLDWVQLDLAALTFSHDEAAREAIACIRDDGLSPEDTAAMAGTSVRRLRLQLDAVEQALGAQLAAATAGDVLGPLDWLGGPTAVLVADKRMPSLDDPDTRRRAEDAAVRRAVERAIDERVRWHEHL